LYATNLVFLKNHQLAVIAAAAGTLKVNIIATHQPRAL
jgi:hypothetical protein